MPIDLQTLARAYDRSAASYDERFRALQRPKYRAAAQLLEPYGTVWLASDPGALILDAGCGTGLFLEWLADENEPHGPLRKKIIETVERGKFVALDASLGMLKLAARRSRVVIAADLACPPLRKKNCALVLSFTALLENVPRSLRALGELVRGDGFLCASFLARESPRPEDLAQWSGLHPTSPPLAAGQDLVHLVRNKPR